MESTCRSTCKFWRKYKESCPFYVETTWMPHDESQAPKIVKDCSPKRSMYLQMELHGKLEAMIKSSNQERNMNHLILTGIHDAINTPRMPSMDLPPRPTRQAVLKLLKQDNNENTDR